MCNKQVQEKGQEMKQEKTRSNEILFILIL